MNRLERWHDPAFALSEKRGLELARGARKREELRVLDCAACNPGGFRHVGHEQVHTERGCVDVGMEPLLRELWRRDVPTKFSCEADDPAHAEGGSSGYGYVCQYSVASVICETLADTLRALELCYAALDRSGEGWVKPSLSVRSALLTREFDSEDRVLRGILNLPSPAIKPLAELLQRYREKDA